MESPQLSPKLQPQVVEFKQDTQTVNQISQPLDSVSAQINDNNKQKQQNSISPLPLVYLNCQKGGFHQNQRLNFVCLQKQCQDNCLLCVVCFQEEHFNHKVNSLRLVVQAARKKSMNKIEASKLEEIKQIINVSQTKLKNKCQLFNNQIKSIIGDINDNIVHTHSKINSELQLKLESNNILESINELNNKDIVVGDSFFELIKNLKEGVPQLWDQNTDQNVENTEASIQNSVNYTKTTLQNKTNFTIKEVKENFEQYLKLLGNIQTSVSQTKYIFTQKLKHPNISIISPSLVKSIQIDGIETYRFAIMEPSLQSVGNLKQKFKFKIKQDSKTWVALGICHKNMIEQQGFNFIYEQLNHGAYLISSNGGSWSSMDSAQNNVVTCFPFYTNDVIIVEFDPVIKKVLFQKQQSGEQHVLDFQIKKDDELHLCVLFYYNDSEVEYQGPI